MSTRALRVAGAGLAAWVILACLTLQAFTADIVVPAGTVVMDRSKTITIADLTPSACGAQTVFVNQNGTVLRGTAAAAQVYLSSGNSDVDGGNGNDCILPGSTSTSITIRGQAGGGDVCYYGPSSAVLYDIRGSCETQVGFSGYFTDPSAGP